MSAQMNTELKLRCDLFADNYLKAKQAFKWEYSYLHYLLALMYAQKGLELDIEKIRQCKELIVKNQGAFSNFRGVATLIFSCMLSLRDNAQESFERVLLAYTELKKQFMPSGYLCIAAFSMEQNIDSAHFEGCAARAREVYDKMKADHFLLTSAEDIPFAVMFALTSASAELSAEMMQRSFMRLRERFFTSNALQSVSHCLALVGDAQQGADRLISLYDELKQKKHHFGVDLELVSLALVTSNQNGSTADILIEICDYLKTKKGFGDFIMGKRHRLMYSASVLAQMSDGFAATITYENISASIMTQIAATSALTAIMAASNNS